MAGTRLLPRPLATVWDWQLRGACRGPAGDLFFHPDGEREPARTRRDVKAKAVCGRCPVLDQCLRHALTTREHHGIWGGLTAAERRQLPGHGLATGALTAVPRPALLDSGIRSPRGEAAEHLNASENVPARGNTPPWRC